MTNLHEKIKVKWPEKVQEIHAHRGDETVIVSRDTFVEIAEFLKADPEFDMSVLMDLTVVDGFDMKWKPRFEVVYHFFSMQHNHRLRVKVKVDEEDAVMPSLSSLWPVADWFEREAWDLFGVKFEGHPNLRRILMYEGFVGHPLRKDYPVNRRQPLIGPKN